MVLQEMLDNVKKDDDDADRSSGESVEPGGKGSGKSKSHGNHSK